MPHWTEDWEPINSSLFHPKAKKLGMLEMFEFRFRYKHDEDGNTLAEDKDVETATEIAWIKRYFRNLFGMEGENWWTSGYEYKTNRMDVYTMRDEWLMEAKLRGEPDDLAILSRIALQVHRG